MDLTVVINDRRDSDSPKRIRITGKADWALGHGRHAESGAGSVLLAVEAKNEHTIGQAECQLLTYLATIRALRKQTFKRNEFVQGFYSDGNLFRFTAIQPDGAVLASRMYELHVNSDLTRIFRWIFTIIETAARPSPSTSSMKPGPERDKEIEGFRENVFLRFYSPSNDDYDDSDLEEVILDERMVVDERY